MDYVLKEKLSKLNNEELITKYMKLIKELESIYEKIDGIDLDVDISLNDDGDVSYSERKQDENEHKIKQILFDLRIAML